MAQPGSLRAATPMRDCAILECRRPAMFWSTVTGAKRLSADRDLEAVTGMSEQAGKHLSGARQMHTSRAALLGLCLAAAAILGAHWSHDVQARIGLALFLAL